MAVKQKRKIKWVQGPQSKGMTVDVPKTLKTAKKAKSKKTN